MSELPEMTELPPVGTQSPPKPAAVAALAYPKGLRKLQFLREMVFDGAATGCSAPIVRVAGVAIIANASCGRQDQDLGTIAALGEELAAVMMPDLVALLGSPVLGYGKAAIVGTGGQLEHGAALLHPRVGKPVREAIGGGAAIIPSNNKIGAIGSAIDIPLSHKDDAWSFAFIDTLTLSISDAPRDDEIAFFLVLSSGRRPAAQIGV